VVRATYGVGQTLSQFNGACLAKAIAFVVMGNPFGLGGGCCSEHDEKEKLEQ
jgi:hypothetical protein